MSCRSLTWWHYWTGGTLYSLLLFYCFGGIVHRACLRSQRTCFSSVQFSRSVGSTLWDTTDCSMPGLPVHQLPEFTQTHVHQVGDAIQPSHPLSSPSSPTFNISQHQGLFKWISSLHQMAKVLELQLQHQSFQWLFKVDFLWGMVCDNLWWLCLTTQARVLHCAYLGSLEAVILTILPETKGTFSLRRAGVC